MTKTFRFDGHQLESVPVLSRTAPRVIPFHRRVIPCLTRDPGDTSIRHRKPLLHMFALLDFIDDGHRQVGHRNTRRLIALAG
jgi:hypothetical protein